MINGGKKRGFKHLGFYLHACWKFNYPFAVRSWKREDYRKMYKLLKELGYDRVMLWPMSEIVPPGITSEERKWLELQRELIADAQAFGLECWTLICADLTSNPEIRETPVTERHFFPFVKTCQGNKPGELEAFLNHLDNIIGVINNADGYVVIDGDPGSYPDSPPEEFLRILHSFRNIVNKHGTNPESQKIIPWLWMGWGADGVWKSDFRDLTPKVLEQLKSTPLAKPWELLPGRSHLDKSFLEADGWANGRVNIEMVDEAGMIDLATLMLYELIEFEPTPPAPVIQFDYMRKVFARESGFAAKCRGVFGNAQQPVMSLPNLYAFGKIARDLNYMDKSDREILTEFAELLGGDAELLVPAWRCAELELPELMPDLPEKLRKSQLRSETAQLIPGGPEKYLDILAVFTEARIKVLQTCATIPGNTDAAFSAIQAVYNWWRMHGYSFQGKSGNCFSWSYTHTSLREPLKSWIKENINSINMDKLMDELTNILTFTNEQISDTRKYFSK